MKHAAWLTALAATLFSAVMAAPLSAAPGKNSDVFCGEGITPVAGFEPAEAMARVKPRYPLEALDDWSEGWVRLNYTVAADGSVRDLIAVDALGPATFVAATLRTFKSWTFKPARRNGVPVDQFGVDFIFQYVMVDDTGDGSVHRAFARRYEEARLLIKAQKFAEAIGVLESALKIKTNLYESAMASFAMSVAYAQLKNDRAALYHSRHATMLGGSYLEKSTRGAAYALRVDLETKDGNFRDAICAYQQMLKEQPAGDARAAAVIKQVETVIANPSPFAVQGRLVAHPNIDGPALWMHPLMRAKFHFDEIKGDLKQFRLVCTGTTLEAKVDPELEWSVPPAAGQCTLRVEGPPDATFLLVETW